LRHEQLKWLLIVALVAVAVVVLAVAAGQMGAFTGREPDDLGVKDGRLKPPSRNPNSVSSQAGLYPDHPQQAYAAIAPLPLRGDAAQSLARVKKILEATPGVRIVRQEPGYLYAQCTTRLMKYVDDLEFWADPAAGVLHVRSASRLGRSDLGVNRARVEAIRTRYNSS
jgi:uncharacterized protein (DUF1499 family)